jgi:hypothetical protein
LLVDVARPKDDGPIDIQACCSDAVRAPEVGNHITLKSQSAIRKMFRRNLWGSESPLSS